MDPINVTTTFIGVDQALRKTGVCVLRGDAEHELLLIDTKELRGPARLLHIKHALAELLSKKEITFAALESGSYDSENSQLYRLGGVNALVQLVFWEHHVGFAEVSPSQLKKFQTKKAGAKKEWMIEAASTFLGYEIHDDNLADAVGLARIAKALHTLNVQTRAEAAVVHKIKTSKNYHPWTTPNDSG